jgi:hypothetical protein
MRKMRAEPGQLLAHAITDRFQERWRIDLVDGILTLEPRHPVGRPATPPDRLLTSALLDRMAAAFERVGVKRPTLLPLRWRRDTDLLISAIQGLDPWLKDGAPRVWREGFLPQPVVRFTGKRDAGGRLLDGYLTSFVNVSCVERIDSVNRHVELVDAWITALSAIGIHAGRLRISGWLAPWRRASVRGITLIFTCDDLEIGDATLLWREPTGRMATDIGSGLERLRWSQTARSWPETVFGPLGDVYEVDVLDAVRTTTLLLMAGIRPGPRGARSAIRKVARRIPRRDALSGLGRLVRSQRAYWTDIGMTGPDWPHLATMLEDEVLRA